MAGPLHPSPLAKFLYTSLLDRTAFTLGIFHTQLGGKNAGIVFADTDLEKCLPTMIKSSFANQGEVCLTTSRIFVQEAIYEEFVKRFVELTK